MGPTCLPCRRALAQGALQFLTASLSNRPTPIRNAACSFLFHGNTCLWLPTGAPKRPPTLTLFPSHGFMNEATRERTQAACVTISPLLPVSPSILMRLCHGLSECE